MSIDIGGGSSGPSSVGAAIAGSAAYLLAVDEFGPPRPHGKIHHVNIPAIIISALIFLAIIAWANVIEHLFFITFPDDPSKVDPKTRYEHTVILFWYAVFWTCLAVLGTAIIYAYIL